VNYAWDPAIAASPSRSSRMLGCSSTRLDPFLLNHTVLFVVDLACLSFYHAPWRRAMDFLNSGFCQGVNMNSPNKQKISLSA
jgi:hypothetical protein